MITIKGSLLKFDKLNSDDSIIPNNVKITIPEKLPLCYNDFHTCIGNAEVERSKTGLDLVAGHIVETPALDKGVLEALISEGAGLGGVYGNVKFRDNNRVVESCDLRCVSIVLQPVNPELTFEIVEDENE